MGLQGRRGDAEGYIEFAREMGLQFGKMGFGCLEKKVEKKRSERDMVCCQWNETKVEKKLF